jgi:hypothetical protein
LRHFRPRSIARAMARGNVRDLVGHNARQLCFGVSFKNEARIDEKESAWKRERVHVLGVDHFDGERNLSIRISHQILADPVHVFGDHWIVDDLGLTFDLLRHLFTQRNLLFDRVKVQALADVTIADLIGIFLLIVCREQWKGEQGTGQEKRKTMPHGEGLLS